MFKSHLFSKFFPYIVGIFLWWVPVICPNKGGHRQYLNEDNSILVKSKWKSVGGLEDERLLYKGQKWIEPNLDNFIEELKNFYENKKYLIETLMIQRDHDITKYSPKRIAKKFVKYIL